MPVALAHQVDVLSIGNLVDQAYIIGITSIAFCERRHVMRSYTIGRYLETEKAVRLDCYGVLNSHVITNGVPTQDSSVRINGIWLRIFIYAHHNFQACYSNENATAEAR
jgi:hypothetical protein